MIWYGSSKDITKWFDKVFKRGKDKAPEAFVFNIDERDIE